MCIKTHEPNTEVMSQEAQRGEYHTGEHILVCLSSATSNEIVVRTAAHMAAVFRCRFTALFVETPAFALMCEEDKNRFRSNLLLAEQLGASIEIVYGEDIPSQIAEYALLSDVSKIVIGNSQEKRCCFFKRAALTERLTELIPNLEIHSITTPTSIGSFQMKQVQEQTAFTANLFDILKSVFILSLSTVIGFVFLNFGLTDANIITVYILGVLIISVITKTRLYSLVSSLISVLVFNFCFTIPRFTFVVDDKGYPVTFVIMFIAALLTGSLAAKLKTQAKQSAQAAFRTKVLFDTNRLLQKALSDDEIVTVTANQLIKLLDRDIVIYPVKDNTLREPLIFSTNIKNDELISDDEKNVASWVLRNSKYAGATTNTLDSAKCLYLSIHSSNAIYGVVGIHINNVPLDSFENSVLLSIIGECALALENSHNAREKEQAAVYAKNEQLRANLLRAISHDLRTPLTSISGNASNLLSNSTGFDDETKKLIYTDIYDDSMWLINLVENLLSISRIEEGKINLRLSTELVDEVISEALRHANRKRIEHTIIVESNDDFIFAKMEAKLIVQVIINLVDNAIKYTPMGSTITIRTKKENAFVTISVADNGSGIPTEVKSHVFDMFFSGTAKIADSRRSLGLGLSLCKSIITAHGGEITLLDNVPQGTIFSFTLPAGEVEIHE